MLAQLWCRAWQSQPDLCARRAAHSKPSPLAGRRQREFQNRVRRAAIIADGKRVIARDLGFTGTLMLCHRGRCHIR
jgi:hypothetical protein